MPFTFHFQKSEKIILERRKVFAEPAVDFAGRFSNHGITRRTGAAAFEIAKVNPAVVTACTEPSARPMFPVNLCRAAVHVMGEFVAMFKIPG